MDTFSITDTGKLRSGNQDCIYCRNDVVGSLPNLFMVADGMGGHKAGDTASRMCIEEMVAYIACTERITPVSAFEQAIENTNRAIYKAATENSQFKGMGTTLVGATIIDDSAYVVNIGDSRLYLMSDNKLRQITVDHSLVEEMVKSGEIKKDEMRNHPNKNIITRAIGTGDFVLPDCFEIKVKQGDVMLLCSDGLSNMVDDKKIENILLENDDVEKACKELVKEANEAGGKDNISVVLVKI